METFIFSPLLKNCFVLAESGSLSSFHVRFCPIPPISSRYISAVIKLTCGGNAYSRGVMEEDEKTPARCGD